ncbi:MAG: 50S ribosomal protein L10 [Fibrobacter sp.]|jgi:large subunit ribosomal protein L10|nr:50S ribosomal protein L10 [Fibrobacter sp.]
MSTKAERTADIEFLEKEFQEATGIFLADNNKINVEKTTKLRSDLRKNGIQFIVVKNTLAKIACSRVGKDDLIPHFKGPTAVAVTRNEGTVPAKIIRDFQKENKDLLGLKIAYVEGSVFKGDDAIKLADLPSREVLLSQLLGCLQAPMGKFAGVLNSFLSKFVGTLNALKEKKEQAQ